MTIAIVTVLGSTLVPRVALLIVMIVHPVLVVGYPIAVPIAVVPVPPPRLFTIHMMVVVIAVAVIIAGVLAP